MNKYGVLLVAMVLTLSLTGCDACKESPLSKIGDSVATLGKKGVEKEATLAERAANRAAKCADQKAGEMKKKMGL